MFPFTRDGSRGAAQPLPLFPLRTVLFPGGVLPLKVFEPRYVEMTKQCLKDEQAFGVVLITEGEEVAQKDAPPPTFAAIGTLARITDWDMPQLGILHLSTVGLERFRVERHAIEPGGLVTAQVVPIAGEPVQALASAYEPLAKLLELIATRVGPENFPTERRYDDASWVGYRLAELLPLPLHIKQSMLEINDAGVRLQVLQQFLRKQGVL